MRISDWSSDVCSSDLDPARDAGRFDSAADDPARNVAGRRLAAPAGGRSRHRSCYCQAIGYCLREASLRGGTEHYRHQAGMRDACGIAVDEGRNPVALAVELAARRDNGDPPRRSEEHTTELQSLMRISYAVLCL